MSAVGRPRKIVVLTVLTLLASIGWTVCTTPGSRTSPDPVNVSPALQIRAPTTAAKRWIRVNLIADSSATVRLRIDSDWQARLPGTSAVLHQDSRLDTTQLRVDDSGLHLGRETFSSGRIELVASEDPAIWVDNHQYRGRIQIIRRPSNRINIVNLVELEDYVASVINSEMPVEFGSEARQAQAVVARTYALFQQKTYGIHRSFDVYASTRSQKYLGYQYISSDGRRLAGESPDSRRLTESTRGVVCLDQGQLFCTYYSAACGGRTVHGSNVFRNASDTLRSQACEWCSDAPLYSWQRRFSRSEFEQQLEQLARKDGRQFGTLIQVQFLEPTTDTKIGKFRFQGTRGILLLTGLELRQEVLPKQLPSPWFLIQLKDSRVTLEGRGHGHGVGLCQWGARGLDRAGRSWRQILTYYYPGSQLARIDLSR